MSGTIKYRKERDGIGKSFREVRIHSCLLYQRSEVYNIWANETQVTVNYGTFGLSAKKQAK